MQREEKAPRKDLEELEELEAGADVLEPAGSETLYYSASEAEQDGPAWSQGAGDEERERGYGASGEDAGHPRH